MNSPEVTVIIVARNESKHIVACLESVIDQFLPGDAWELVLVDGESEDDTIQLATICLKSKSVNYTIIHNPRRILATGWNLGIMHAKGSYVIRPDAHSTLGRNYIRTALKTLYEKPEVAAVGGILNTLTGTFMGQIIREALSMKTGVGNSSFRTGAHAGYKDTVVYGLYRKNIFDVVGLFNEKLIRHQDTEMHHRIRKAGMKFYMDPDMEAGYYCRDSIPALLSQMYDIGYYFSYLVEEGAFSSLSWRHRMPFLFYAFIILLLITGLFYVPALLITATVFSLYLIFIFTEAISRFLAVKKSYALLTTGIIPLMHGAYALGTFMGWMRLLVKSRRV